MSDLLEFLRTHEEAFRSRSRLASLYSDFGYQKTANPDGYQANASAWLRALTAAAKAGLIPAQTGARADHFSIRTGEELARALTTPEHGRPLALGSVLQDAVQRKELVPVRDFMDAKKSIYAKSWVPTPWEIVSWGLRQLGAGSLTGADKLVAGNFVVMANVEAAAKAVLDQASKIATSNTSRIFSRELFISTFADAIGEAALSDNDASILLIHLARDRTAISYSPSRGTIRFKSASEKEPSPITQEDVNIASMRTLISSLEPQIEELTARVSKLDIISREAVANKNSIAAKSALRSKKLAETKLQQRTATLTQLEEVYDKIEQAADQVEMVRVMEAAGQTLKSLNKQTGGVERVQDVMEGLQEEMTNTEEISQALNESSVGAVDEGEVEEELEELEKVEREKREALERKEREAREALDAESKRQQEEAEAEARKKQEDIEAEETRRRLAELDAPVNGPKEVGKKHGADAVTA